MYVCMYVTGLSHRGSCISDTCPAVHLSYTQSQEILRYGFECLSGVSIILFVAALWSLPVFSIQYKRSHFFSQKRPKSGKQLHSMRNLRLTLCSHVPYTPSNCVLLGKCGCCFIYKATKFTYSIHNSRFFYHSSMFRLYCDVIMAGVIKDYTVVYVVCAFCEFSKRK
jgi:hypothetical protein